MIIGFCMGLANGFVIPVAQRYGAKDYKDMRRFVANSIWLTVFAAIMSITVCILCRSVLIAMKTPADILDLAYDYIFIILQGYRSHTCLQSPDRDHPFPWGFQIAADLSADGSSGKYRI